MDHIKIAHQGTQFLAVVIKSGLETAIKTLGYKVKDGIPAHELARDVVTRSRGPDYVRLELSPYNLRILENSSGERQSQMAKYLKHFGIQIMAEGEISDNLYYLLSKEDDMVHPEDK